MQGRLQGKPVAVRIESPCAGCGRPIAVEVDQDFRWQSTLRPLILEPSVDWSRFSEPSILHAY